ncbi:MAG: NifU family protein [Gemmatimonadota bacterium]|nr:NifU family protein [Gemmatimonadota bacterium]
MRASNRRGAPGTSQIEARIRAALVAMQPLLHFEGARMELVEFHVDNGLAILRLAGDCPDCDLTAVMLRQGIEAQLRMRVPEVREVQAL